MACCICCSGREKVILELNRKSGDAAFSDRMDGCITSADVGDGGFEKREESPLSGGIEEADKADTPDPEIILCQCLPKGKKWI